MARKAATWLLLALGSAIGLLGGGAAPATAMGCQNTDTPASSMVAGRFFSHYGDFFGHPASASPVSRLRQVGYIRPHNAWIIGENLHWTTGEGSTPAATVAAWMNSAEHRKYLLKRKFRDLGVAAIRGIPYDPSQTDGITVATEYGFRSS